MAVSLMIFAATVTLGLVTCVASATPTRNRVAGLKNGREENAVAQYDAPLMTRSSNVCCSDLGCYDSGGDFWHILHRPITSTPDCTLRDKIKYHLNTRRNPQVSQVISSYRPETIKDSNFDASKNTYVLIHGFLDVFTSDTWTSTLRELLQHEECNVIRVDWSDGNRAPYYQATANTRLVGTHAGRLVEHLVKVENVAPQNVHFMGHSLGAHISGYAGEELNNRRIRLGRITGLDPAGLYFENLGIRVRLDPTDARFVDTIVTDAGSITSSAFGAELPMGHLNFYPNGGVRQPGCGGHRAFLDQVVEGREDPLALPIDWKMVEEIIGKEVEASGDEAWARGAMGCSHGRAPVLFYESINDEGCNITSYECDTYANFQAGKCFSCENNKCAELGFHVEQSLVTNSERQKSYFSLTTGETPYCLTPHRITFQIQNKTKDNDSKRKPALVYVTLIGTHGQKKSQLTANWIYLNPGEKYSFVFESPAESLGFIHSLYFTWVDQSSNLNPGNWWGSSYIWIESNITLTDVDEKTVPYIASTNKVQSGKNVVCTRQT
ncbi:hypothetical protein RvY_06875 [Ramazzottius varieornatus]|uniref:Lipase domain-containing protein n=1 Tax=Ramazzottius varieornatus TaxID=947166 RepID=A0A1D1V5D1_RAMVA|nr:hypothetical protein RvY_06875 [Ramazzottius varieornatus]